MFGVECAIETAQNTPNIGIDITLGRSGKCNGTRPCGALRGRIIGKFGGERLGKFVSRVSCVAVL